MPTIVSNGRFIQAAAARFEKSDILQLTRITKLWAFDFRNVYGYLKG